ncbi:MAG: MaoC family dehydratase [Alphaproteobacteria bacterium]
MIGSEVGVSDWVTVDQKMIDAFADATGDHQWIHVDVERARRELPGGTTIAHGYLLLSLYPRLTDQCFTVGSIRHILNYGCNTVRFTSMVPAGSRVRLRLVVASTELRDDGGWRVACKGTLELDGSERPAVVAETVRVLYPAD